MQFYSLGAIGPMTIFTLYYDGMILCVWNVDVKFSNYNVEYCAVI